MVTLVKEHGLEYLFAATVLTGVLQIIAGWIRLGELMRFVSRSVVTGFVNALAILIFMAQLPELTNVGWQVYAMTAAGLGIIYGLPRLTTAVPSPLITGMATILWCYTRNDAVKVDGVDYHTSADLSSQAIHLGVTIQADIIKQKLPTNNGGYNATGHGKTHPKVYSELTTDNPIDLTRYQVLNSYNGRIGVINSGGASTGNDANDLSEAVLTAVVNKRAGGQGLILGRKAFQKEYKDGLSLLRAVQDVYLNDDITIS